MPDFLGKCRRTTVRSIYRALNIRPGSQPFISGDEFRSWANHVYDERQRCSPGRISKEGEIVFVKTDFVDDWFEKVHPEIEYRYKLITHNSDYPVGKTEASFADGKIIAWFAQNNTYDHPQITPVPAGIENMRWFGSGWVFREKAKGLKKTSSKNRILYGFNIDSNPAERREAENSLARSKVADGIESRLEPERYFELLKGYRFVASPEGNGSDCHRTWEAIALGAVPIIKNSSNNQIFHRFRLPVLLIDDWADLEEMTEGRLADIYSSLEGRFTQKFASAEFWRRLINVAN